MDTDDVEKEIRNATRYYWATLSDQEETQLESEATAGGRRSQVVGGSQMDGFAELIENTLVDEGVPRKAVLHDHDATLPGFYRATKRWDLAVVLDDELLAVMELKSIASSFGNNLNIDRAELLCLRMVRQRLVDAAAFLTSNVETGLDGEYDEPNEELTFRRYLSSLVAHVKSHVDYEQPEIDDNNNDSEES